MQAGPSTVGATESMHVSDDRDEAVQKVAANACGFAAATWAPDDLSVSFAHDSKRHSNPVVKIRHWQLYR